MQIKQLPMFETLTTATSAGLMSSSADSRAKTSAARETVLDWKAHALVYGGKCTDLYANYDRVRSCWKMLRQSRTSAVMRQLATFDPQTRQWLLARWPTSGMTRNGKLWLLPMPAHLISVTDGSVWPTPSASDTANRQPPKNVRVRDSGMLEVDNEFGSQVRLAQTVRYYETKRMWHTSIANDAVKSGDVEPKRENGLSGQVRYWSTPTAQDGKNDAPPSQWNRNSDPLNVQVATHAGDKLNPDWEEQIMGFPVGWTDISS